MSARSGFSLLELIVAIVILALIVSIVAVAPVRREHEHADAITRASSDAEHTGEPATAADTLGDLVVNAAAYPDGRVIAETTSVTLTAGEVQ